MTGTTPPPPDRGERSGAFKFNWLKQVTRTPGLTATQLYAATAAFNKADEYGRDIFLGYESLAATTGMGKTSARLALKSLVDLGLLRRTARGGRSGDGRKWASAYELTFSTDSPLTVDPVEESASTVSGLPVESYVNRQSSAPQPSVQRSSTVSGLLPNKPAPINPLPIDPLAGGVALVNAGAGARETTAIRPASIFVEKNQPFIPEDKKNTAPRYAEWQHLLRRDLIVELEDIAQQIVDENNLAGLTDLADDAVRSTVDWLLTAYSESTRPQTRNGIHIWLMEIRPEPDVPLFQSVLSTLHRRAS
ncbi:hypothetical protein [Tsukamurella paurometabola]|uniref:Helix-turn-helix domain-containing protein n=1 Tax=Tsukamurella paurometabola TaxID=2061 RepID=A0A3P8MBT2_TSUPA|nr:hypothetical protein [Tsukamurella paurometabola]UEA84486.1 hypothetical protein LK411_06595 [Tsukamurella paurometabola]VDR37053.1 Uncharacterised protein [Tsukamurella paurometabola]